MKSSINTLIVILMIVSINKYCGWHIKCRT